MNKKIVLIGIGKMGSAIAEQLIKAGFLVTIYNRTFEKTKPIVALGAKAEKSLQSAVDNADIVFTSLFDDDSLISVTEELLKSLKPGVIHVSTSTVLPDTATMLAQQHFDAGCFYIAAPVLGVPKAVRSKTAMTMCAGHQDSIDTVMLLLLSYSGSVENLGDNASHANVFKICTNYSLISALELISELYVFSEESGLDPTIIPKWLKRVYGHPVFHLYIDKINDKSFDDVNFDVRCADKDVNLFQKAFAQVGVVPDIANMVAGKFTQALKEGMGDRDWSSMSEIVRRRSGFNENKAAALLAEVSLDAVPAPPSSVED